MCQQGDTNKQWREKRISWTRVQPKNLKTRTWAARVVTYLLYHKCNAEPVNVYTSLLTTYGPVLWQIANIYLYCTVNLQDSALNNYYERRKNQTSESTEKNSELHPDEINTLTTLLSSWSDTLPLSYWREQGQNLIIIVHQHKRTVSDTCSKLAVHQLDYQ